MRKTYLLVGAALWAVMSAGKECARFGFGEVQGACTLDALRGIDAVFTGDTRRKFKQTQPAEAVSLLRPPR